LNEWTEKEEKLLEEYWPDKDFDFIQSVLPKRTASAIRTKARDMRLKKIPKVFPKKDSDIIKTGKELFEEAIKNCERNLARAEINNEIKIEFPISDYPDGMILVCLSDFHLGSKFTEYRKLYEDLETLKRCDCAFGLMLGDIIDNFQPSGKHKGGQNDALYPLPEQKKMAQFVFKNYGQHFLAIILGCHDDWSFQSDGFDMAEYFEQDINGAYLGYGGNIILKVGNIEYKIHARHTYRFQSPLNLTNSIKRMHREHGPFDIGIVAHRHTPDYELTKLQDHDVLCILNGSYKPQDRYSLKLGFKKSNIKSFAIYLDPREKKMLPFPSLKEAEIYLRGLRQNGKENDKDIQVLKHL